MERAMTKTTKRSNAEIATVAQLRELINRTNVDPHAPVTILWSGMEYAIEAVANGWVDGERYVLLHMADRPNPLRPESETLSGKKHVGHAVNALEEAAAALREPITFSDAAVAAARLETAASQSVR